MGYIRVFFSIAGSLGLFLYGMKVMSDGIQQAAGTRMQKALSFMAGHRLSAVLTGFGVTAVIQSSSATTVMVVSFVNAGLLTLKQAIGVIMGANVGTTVTAWIVSIIGFSLKLGAIALPAVGIGFIMSMIKWKYRELGVTILGFGLLFMGLDLLTKSMPTLSPEALAFIGSFSGRGFVSTILGAGVGIVITLIIHSSSASTAIFLTMAYQGMINYEMAAAMILGANIGTTIDAALASIGAKSTARQSALVHVLFNVIGTIWVLAFFRPFLNLVDAVTPGSPTEAITSHLAMLHTIFNTINTLLFFPFVNQFAALVGWIIKDKGEEQPQHYRLELSSGLILATPEFSIVRAEKEIRDMAGLVSDMYAEACDALTYLAASETDEKSDKEKSDKNRITRVDTLIASMKAKEDYSDEMREELTRFLIECTRQQLSPKSEYNISQLLRIIADLEDMADDCCGISLILERSVKKDQLFKRREMEALAPYVKQVKDFLAFVREHLGHPLSQEQVGYAELIERQIDKARNKLRKLGRKRIEAGADVKTELLFMDLVRRIELLGDLCYNISEALFHMR
ncbi:phosphate:sodium symporter [Spirochaetia bacterium]|nr:phosphate:sodium symporter [Spirochaetia bacterium]